MNLKNNAVFQIVGPSGSGKTHFVCKLLSINSFKKNFKKFIGIKEVMEKKE
jgi:ABC-type phosphate transport system ATPase subunit